jgi:DNA polymerase-3 subunit delta
MKLDYKSLIKNLKEGKIEPLYFFHGPQEYLKEEALSLLVSKLVDPNLKSFNLDILFGPDTSADEIFNLTSTLPMNAERRLVIVREAQRLPAPSKNRLLKLLPHQPDTTTLALVFTEVKFNQKFYQELRKLAVVVEFGNLAYGDLTRWLSSRAGKLGKKLSPEVVNYLLEAVGDSLFDLANELEKMAYFVGERVQIKREDVQAVFGPGHPSEIYEILDLVGEKKIEPAMRVLSNLFAYRQSPSWITASLRRHYSRLYFLKSANGKRFGEVARELGIWESKQESYRRQVSSHSLEELKEKIYLIYDAELDLRSTLSSKLVLELLIYNLCR